MNLKSKIYQQAFALLTSLILIFQSLAPAYLFLANPTTASAQEATSSTEQTTPTPTEVTPTITSEPTPTSEPTVEPTPAEIVTPTETPAPTTQPENTPSSSSTENTNQSNAPPSETPAPSVTASPEVSSSPISEPARGHLEASIIENTDADSLNLDLNPTNVSSASLTTDKGDYAPTDTVIVSGTEFLPNTDYTLIISSSDDPAVNFETKVTTNDKGEFIYSYQLDGNYRPNYNVEVKDEAGNIVASTTFTDSLLCTSDVDGANDQPGQKDLTKMCFDKTISPLLIKFNWDEIYGGGNNTYDACTLWDTDSDGKANYALCNSLLPNSTTDLMEFSSFTLYSCGDTKSDRCGQPANSISASGTSCSAAQANEDPFSAGTAYPQDTVGTCALNPSNFGSTQYVLLNLCSFPSGQPNSDPSDCVGEPTGGFITVTKVATPNDGTTFNFGISGTSNYTFSINGSGTSQRYSVENGTYSISETVPSGWSLDSASCVDNGGSSVGTISGNSMTGIVVDAGDDIACTFNDSLQQGTIVVHKDVQGPSGEDITDISQNFTAELDGANSQTFTDGGTVTYSNITAGSHTVTEGTLPSGYSIYGISATQGGSGNVSGLSVTVTANQTTHVYVTNRQQQTTLTVIKQVTNDNGGLKTASNFTINITGTNVSNPSFPGVGIPGTTVTLEPGSYSVSEDSDSGYTATYSTDCSGTITLGQTKTCTVTNNDKAGTLIIKKVVTNNNGGTKVASDFSFSVNTGVAQSFESDGQNDLTVDAGTYNVTEPAVTGYSTSYDNCSDLVITNGGSATCTITNNDNAPSLHLRKTLTKDNGGTASEADWTLTATGALSEPTSLSGTTPVDSGLSFKADTYALGESGPSGYTASAWDCEGGTQEGDTITLGLGQSATCTITNNDNAPSLTLDKIVTNNNGGSAAESEWTLTATGPTSISGPGAAGSADVVSDASFDAGTYTLSESAGPSGYTASVWSCTNGVTVNGSSEITIALGQSTVCSITNDDQQGTLIVKKVVLNDNGGTLEAQDFSFQVNSGTATNFEADGQNDLTVDAGTYTVTEPTVAGYDTSYDNCTGVVVSNSGTQTCTITNNDKPAHLKVIKHVVNDDDGTANSSDFTMTISGVVGGGSFSGEDTPGTDTVVEPGTYSVTEVGSSGYAPNYSTDCSGTIALGETKTCTVTNDDIAPSLTLVKTVINDNGGTLDANDFNLRIDGVATSSGAAKTLSAGAHIASESAAIGYSASDWGEDCAPDGSITLAPGDNKTCTITNDDIAPSLTLTKIVDNSYGGLASAGDWTLTATGLTTISGLGGVTSDSTFSAGTYALSEDGLTGYSDSSWSCVKNGGASVSGSSVNIGLGDVVSCEITNSDIAPTLKLVKLVTNDDGGTATPSAWILTADGDSNGFSDSGNSSTFHPVTANFEYNLSESGPDGYTEGDWNCDGGDQNENIITLNLAENVTCTITNDDVAPTLTLVKYLPNDNGGTATQDDFNVYIDGGLSSWGTHTLTAGSFTVSESTASGYTASDWGTDCATDGTITLGVGDEKTCSITNDDQPGKISGKKFNDLNGDHQRDNTTTDPNLPGWTITLDRQNDINPPVCSGTIVGELCVIITNDSGNYAFNGLEPGIYIVSEVTQTGWTQTRPDATYGGLGRQANGTYILTIGSGTEITGRDFGNQGRGTITVKKDVDSDGDGTVDVSDATDWFYDIDSAGSFQTGSTQEVAAGTYTISEQQQENYHVTGLICGETEYGETESQEIAIDPGDSLVCTFTNTRDTGSLQVNKEVDIDGDGEFDGGNDQANDLGFRWGIDSETPEHLMGSVADPLPTGSYSVSENDIAGYTFTGWYDNNSDFGSCDEPEEETLPESINVSTDNQSSITLCNSRDTGRIIIQKLIDEDGDLQTTDDRIPGADWVMDVDGTGQDTSNPSLPTTDENGNTETGNIKTGEYTAVEGSKEGYHIVSASCSAGEESSRGTYDGTDSVDGIEVGKDETVNCTFINTQNDGSITILKNIDNNGDGDTDDEGDVRNAQGWTYDIADGDQNIPMGGDKSLARGSYTISEDEQAGYKLLGWSCFQGEENEQTGTTNSIEISVRNGSETTCTFENQVLPPVLTLTKANNKTGVDVSAGSSVLYTLTLTLTGSPLENVSLIDLPPAGFKYRLGSWTASSNLNLGLVVSEPTYASPGIWNLGDMQTGETITLTYIADIDTSVDPGLYKDLAWAQGTATGDTTYANIESDPAYFVSTDVNVALNSSGSTGFNVINEKQEEVLGASIALPSSGAQTVWVALASLLLISGIGLFSYGLVLRRRNA
ncbi:MAG: hypothetical protein Q7S44_03635 [bacterium]|nr:hypothetical protein [bacterium]